MTGAGGQPGPYNSRAQDAVIDAYYGRVVIAADAARLRAQSAYAIASAIAGVLVGAALLSSSATVATWTKLIGVAALACWLLSSSLYIRAVSQSVPVPTAAQPDANELVRTVIANIESERRQIESWYNRANRITLLAMLLTATALVTALVPDRGADYRHGTLVLNPAGEAALGGVCDLSGSGITGDINLRSLERNFVEIKGDRESCHGKRVELRIGKEQVLSVAVDVTSS